MKQLALWGALMLIATEATSQTPADTIRQLDSAWARMYQANDTTLAVALYADDLVWTMVNGNSKDKRAEMFDVAPAAGVVTDYFRTSGVTIHRLPGDGAVVVTGLAEWQVTMNGRSSAVARRYTHVYERGGPLGWRIRAVHMGQAPSAPSQRRPEPLFAARTIKMLQALPTAVRYGP